MTCENSDAEPVIGGNGLAAGALDRNASDTDHFTHGRLLPKLACHRGPGVFAPLTGTVLF